MVESNVLGHGSWAEKCGWRLGRTGNGTVLSRSWLVRAGTLYLQELQDQYPPDALVATSTAYLVG
jgi:hypothetical protein